MAEHPEIEVVHDAEGLATRVAFTLLERISAAQAQGRVPHIALTGGTIADRVHHAVARATAETPTAVDWSRVEIWWGDERYVPEDDEQRNAGQARRAFLDEVGADPARVHEMPASDGPYDDVDDRIAVAVHDSPKPPPDRISLTYPALNRTSEVWFLVTTQEKAEPAARAIAGADRHEVPAAGVHGQDRTIWFLDEAASSRLPR